MHATSLQEPACAALTGPHTHESSPQQSDIERLIPFVRNGVREMVRAGVMGRPGRQEAAVCIDRGCGAGANATRLTSAFARAVQRESRSSVLTFHNERPRSDFSGLAERLVRLPSARVKSRACCRGRFSAMVPGSFLDQQLPDGSVHMIVSNAALQWLDVARIPNRCHCSGGHLLPEDFASVAEQQWETFLTTASRELAVGGKLVVSFIGAQSAEMRREHVPLRLLRMAAATTIERLGLSCSTAADTVLPVYLRTRAEVLKPFEKNATVGLPLEIEQCRVEAVGCPYFTRFLQDHRPDDYASCFTKFIRAFSEAAVTDWLQPLFAASHSTESISSLVEQFYTDIERTVLDAPERWRMRRDRIVLTARRVSTD